jgi:hypothetical protein
MAITHAKTILLAGLVACVLAFPGPGMADEASIPSSWRLIASVTYEPAMDVYFGKLTLSHYVNPKSQDAGRATFDVWGKYVYKKPQVRGGRSFTTDIVEFSLDCNASTIADVREILQDADGNTVYDKVGPATPKKIDFRSIRDLSGYPEAVNIAYATMNFTCNSDGD